MAAAYTQVFQAAVRKLSKQLTLQEQGLLWMLTAYIGRSDTVLRDERGLPLTSASIAKLMGTSKQYTNRVLRQLIDAGALRDLPVGNTRCFAFNTRLAHRYAGGSNIRNK